MFEEQESVKSQDGELLKWVDSKVSNGFQIIIFPNGIDKNNAPKLFNEFLLDLTKSSEELKLRYGLDDFKSIFKISTIKREIYSKDLFSEVKSNDFKNLGVDSFEVFFTIKRNKIKYIASHYKEMLFLLNHYFVMNSGKLEYVLIYVYGDSQKIPFKLRFNTKTKEYEIPDSIKMLYARIFPKTGLQYVNQIITGFNLYVKNLNINTVF